MTEHEQHSAVEPAENAHAHNDNFVFRGQEYPIPLYTAVYIGLGLLTLIEITLSQIERGGLTIPVMLIIAVLKASLVVWFYMHLNKDSRIFALTLLIPTVLVILATIFLMIVPTGY